MRLPALDGDPVAERRREHLPQPQRTLARPLARAAAAGAASCCSSGASTSTSTSPRAELSVEQKQIVEIARALSIGARFLILDEPTASLESSAIERLFERVRRMKESGVAILYISHHLEEIYEICDRVTVLRDGKRIVTAPVAELDHERLVAAMVGGELARAIRERDAAGGRVEGPPRLRVRGLSVQTPLGSRRGREPRRARGRVRRPLRPPRLRERRRSPMRSPGSCKPAAGTIELDGKLLRAGQGRRRAAARQSATCRRTATRAASSRRSASPRTSRCRSSSGSRGGDRLERAPGAPQRRRSPSGCRSSRAAATSRSRS